MNVKQSHMFKFICCSKLLDIERLRVCKNVEKKQGICKFIGKRNRPKNL